ncbi:MAG: hypothetical protein NWQ46_11005 [Spirosomaceae bacterium]|nr:hypothetical protein [Spirosomataceae bacterium]
MPKNIDKPLENAILNLPQTEKDKFLLRLIAKDKILIEQLQVKLLEDDFDLRERKEEIKKRIIAVSKMTHSTPGWMMMDMRDMSGIINHYFKVTKDKYGEVELQLFLLLSFFDNQQKFMQQYTSRADKLALYVAKRAETILNKLGRLHEDYRIEFERDVNRLLDNVHHGVAEYYARQLQLPKEI